MIRELAVLNIDPQRADEFEAAFADAKPIISAAPGLQRLALSRDAVGGALRAVP